MLIIHHLGVSQSDRIVWLMEELGLPYEMVWHRRGPDGLMPASYVALHPAATAPVVQDGERMLSESAAIVEYICHRYGGGRLTVGPDRPEYFDYLYWLQLNNNVLGLFFTKLALGGSREGVLAQMIQRREDGYARLAEQTLATSPYLAGEEFTAADIMGLYCLRSPRMLGRAGRPAERARLCRAHRPAAGLHQGQRHRWCGRHTASLVRHRGRGADVELAGHAEDDPVARARDNPAQGGVDVDQARRFVPTAVVAQPLMEPGPVAGVVGGRRAQGGAMVESGTTSGFHRDSWVLHSAGRPTESASGDQDVKAATIDTADAFVHPMTRRQGRDASSGTNAMQPRYSAMNQALHWITALCMFAILPLAWVMTNAKDSAFSEGLYNWHKTLGGIVLLITLFRIVWRMIDPPPAMPASLARIEKGLAHLAYGLFFFILLWMPITGFLTSTYGGHPTKLFNLVPTPQLLPKDKGLSELFGGLHGVGQWAVYGLILLHVGAVVVHLIWRRDGLLGRMLPANATEPADII